MTDPLRVLCVVGARPNFPKVAPILRALRALPGVQAELVHTGQHYDAALSGEFLEDLEIPAPDVHLGVGSGRHGAQTAEILARFERCCVERRPDAVVVVGDVNSTPACALAAAKLGIPVAHVEAGLRGPDRTMPEEINRRVTDAVATLHYTHCPDASANLRREGVPESRIRFVGNVMIDSLLAHREAAREPAWIEALGLAPGGFGLVTLHRPALVDHRAPLRAMLDALGRLSARVPLVFPVHPRTEQRLRRFGLLDPDAALHELPAIGAPTLRGCPPARYLEFLWAMDHARLVITDSGGIQEETTVLGVPCVTARDGTERPVTVTRGTNRVAGRRPDAVARIAGEILDAPPPPRPPTRTPELWDGRAAERIAADLTAALRTGLRGASVG